MPSASQEDNSSYTQLGIMAQIWVAFGQGTGSVRISQKAVMALHERYFEHIEKTGIAGSWGTEAVQVLERIRAIGRLAALKAAQRADTAISAEDVTTAAAAVQYESDTSHCPP